MDSPKSLVLVVGAGASEEAGLPLGAELKDQIASALNINFDRMQGQRFSGDAEIAKALYLIARPPGGNGSGNIVPFRDACEMIRQAMPQAPSIDNFIDVHRDNKEIEVCGKLAIANRILKAEKKSLMYVDPSNIYNKIDFKKLEKTWYTLFFRLLVENCPLNELAERLSRIAIITFNYDRCIEHYLHCSFINYYGVEFQEATALLDKLQIFHPYGFIGELNHRTTSHGIFFGEDPPGEQLLKIAENLKTFTEGTDETHSDIVALRATLQSSKRIVFLGFAFHRQNLELLFGDRNKIPRMETPDTFATSVGLSPSDEKIIKQEITDITGYYPNSITMYRGNCFELFEEFGRALSLR